MVWWKLESNPIEMNLKRPGMTLAAALLATVFGGIVLYGWGTHSLALTQIHPSYPAIPFDTGLGFLLAGLGLGFVGRSRLTEVAGVLLSLLGLLTLTQYILGVDWGIHGIFLNLSTSGDLLNASRMAPNTAVCFILFGAALVVSCHADQFCHSFKTVGSLSMIALALSITALSGHWSGLQGAYGWGSASNMGLTTATGLLVLAAGFICLALMNCLANKQSPMACLPIMVFVGIITGTVCLWQALIANEQTYLQSKIESNSESFAGKLSTNIGMQFDFLAHMGVEWEHRGEPDWKEFQIDAQYVLKQYPGFKAVGWMDAALDDRWTTLAEANGSAPGFEFSSLENRKFILEQAQIQGELMVWQGAESIQEKSGFLMVVPVFQNGKIAGAILGLGEMERFLQSLIRDVQIRDYTITVFKGEDKVYSTGDATDTRWKNEVTLNDYDLNLRIEFSLKPKVLARVHSKFIDAVLIMGSLLAVLLASALRLAQRAQSHSSELKIINQELETQVEERQHAEKALQRAHDDLERRVQERTRDLEASNKKLQSEIMVRRETEKSLLYSRKRLQSIMHHAPDAIFTIDDQGIIQSSNPATSEIFGYAASELYGQNISMLVPEPYRSQHDSYLQKYFQSGESKIIGGSLEVEGLRKDGTRIPVDLAVSELKVEGQRLFTGILRDITDRKQTEKNLTQVKEEAEKASCAKSEFLSRMSHELRTPLNAILGFGQLLEMDANEPLTENQHIKVNEIVNAGDHLLELINEVLDLARIESGKFDLSFEEINLVPFIESTLQFMEPLAEKYNIRLINRVSGEQELVILADPTRLKQVLLNLLSNGIKYNEEGGSVTIECEAKDTSRIIMHITDTGAGIAKERQDELFEPFNRLDADQAGIEGTGIGLTICKRLMEMMNGCIRLESAPGEGSRFSIELPQGNPQQPAKVDNKETVLVESRFVSQTPRQAVLYVEDNPANLQLVKHIMQRIPEIQLLTAPEAGLGIELARVHQPDLILMDIYLPGMNGIEAFKKLQTMQETRHIPVIAVSANAMQDDIDRALAMGFKAYIAKPIDVSKFLNVLEKNLAEKEKSV